MYSIYIYIYIIYNVYVSEYSTPIEYSVYMYTNIIYFTIKR